MTSTVAVIPFTSPGATGNQDYTKSGFGIPDAIVIWVGGQPSGSEINFSFGLSDFTRHKAHAFFAIDNGATRAVARSQNQSGCLTGTITASSTTVGLNGTASAITDGVRVNWSTVSTGWQSKPGCVILIKDDTGVRCDQVTMNNTANVTVSGLGFEPQTIFAFTTGLGSAATQALGHSRTSIGVGSNDGAGGFDQAGMEWRIRNSSLDVEMELMAAHVCGQRGSWHAALESPAAGGFTLNPLTNAGTDLIFYLACGGLKSDVWQKSCPASTGDDSARNVGGFDVGALLFLGTHVATPDVAELDDDAGAFSIGATEDLIEDNWAYACEDGDGDNIFIKQTTGFEVNTRTGVTTTEQYEFTVLNYNSPGYQLNFSNVSSGREMILVALGDVAAAVKHAPRTTIF